LKILIKNFKKNQYEFERNSILVIGSLYGIDIFVNCKAGILIFNFLKIFSKKPS